MASNPEWNEPVEESNHCQIRRVLRVSRGQRRESQGRGSWPWTSHHAPGGIDDYDLAVAHWLRGASGFDLDPELWAKRMRFLRAREGLPAKSLTAVEHRELLVDLRAARAAFGDMSTRPLAGSVSR